MIRPMRVEIVDEKKKRTPPSLQRVIHCLVDFLRGSSPPETAVWNKQSSDEIGYSPSD